MVGRALGRQILMRWQRKTCIKKLMKYLPISPEIQRINEADNAVVKYEDGELENEFVELNVDQETGEILGEA